MTLLNDFDSRPLRGRASRAEYWRNPEVSGKCPVGGIESTPRY
jgi:hypothetical protein